VDEIMRSMQGSDEEIQAIRTRALPVWLDLVSSRLLTSIGCQRKIVASKRSGQRTHQRVE
jgi:hypothetical protein